MSTITKDISTTVHFRRSATRAFVLQEGGRFALVLNLSASELGGEID